MASLRRHLLTKILEILHEDFQHKIVFAHTKFGLVRMKGSGVNGGRIPPPSRHERVFKILAWIGLRLKSFHFILAQSGNSIIATACPLKSS